LLSRKGVSIPYSFVLCESNAAPLSLYGNTLRLSQTPFTLQLGDLLCFIALNLIITPPNFLWQVFLEARFPSYTRRERRGKDHLETGRSTNDLDWLGPTSYGATLSDDDDDDDDEDNDIKPKQNWRDGQLNWVNLTKKLAIDCFTVGALVNIIAFFVIMGILKAMHPSDIMRSLRMDAVPMFVAGLKVWAPTSVIGYCAVPAEKRILYFSFIGLCWGIYLSLVGSRM
jgi:protein Mpv17